MIGPLRLHLGDGRVRDLGRGQPAVREPDEAGPAVGGVGHAVDVAVSFQLVHEEAHRLLGDPRLLGQLGEPTALGREPTGQPGLRHGEVSETCGAERLEYPRLHRAVRHEEQQPDVPPVRRGFLVHHTP
jgi:hypothetical protein